MWHLANSGFYLAVYVFRTEIVYGDEQPNFVAKSFFWGPFSFMHDLMTVMGNMITSPQSFVDFIDSLPLWLYSLERVWFTSFECDLPFSILIKLLYI